MTRKLPFNRSQWVLETVWERSKALSISRARLNSDQFDSMAYHEMRLILTKMLYNFDYELCQESDNWSDQKTFTIWEKKPLIVKLFPVGA